MNKQCIIKANPKINLTLDVLGKSDNGYHNLKMIMCSLNFFDKVTVGISNGGIELKTNLFYLPSDSKNIAYKAAEKFFEYFDISGKGVKINIEKSIPVGAGLAGGSTDAAAVLKAMNKLFNVNADIKELMAIGKTIGADIPYCLHGGYALAEGIGEIITPIKTDKSLIICLAKPKFSVSTASVFKAVDEINIIKHPDTESVIKALQENRINDICGGLYNVLEGVTAKLHPEIDKMKNKMIEYKAKASIMSGSGPTVFGIFSNINNAKDACAYFRSIGYFSIVSHTIV